LLLLPKAFPTDEKDRFKLLLVLVGAAGEVLGRRNPTADLVEGWNANEEVHSAATSTKRYETIRLDLVVIIVAAVRTLVNCTVC